MADGNLKSQRSLISCQQASVLTRLRPPLLFTAKKELQWQTFRPYNQKLNKVSLSLL